MVPGPAFIVIRHCRLQTLTLQSSSLKLLDQLKPNLVGMFIEWFSTFFFFIMDQKST
jgi:hypothetical protein